MSRRKNKVIMTVGRAINTCSAGFVCSSDTENEGTIRTTALTVKTDVLSLSQHREEDNI